MPALSSERKRFLEKYTLQYMKHVGEVAEYLDSRGIDPDLAHSTGLGVVRNPPPQHEMYEGSIAIPYLTDEGPVNMRFRCMKDHNCKELGHGKYSMMKGWEGNLYGVQQIREAEEWIAVTEGEFDSLILRKVGIPALGVPGSTMWKPWWPNVFDDFSLIYVFTDGDLAGDKMWERWSHEIDRCVRVKMPYKQDVTSFYVSYGKDALRAKVKR